jgi:hypothetical protein
MLNNQIAQSTTTNHLKCFNESGEVQVERVWDIIDASRAEMARVFGLPADQLRQERLTGKAKERVEQLAAALEFVSETFDGNEKKTRFWIRTPNLNFGGFSPKQLIFKGKYKKVLEFILAARASD